MSPFRRVDGNQAGPHAVGILIPPGYPTLVILRPRALSVDLVLTRPESDGTGGARFWEIGDIEGRLMGCRVHRSLEEWALGGPGRVEVMPLTGSGGWRVHVEIGAFPWAVCRRVHGQPYRGMAFRVEEEARNLADRLAAVLCPSGETEREVYLNLNEFSPSEQERMKDEG